MKRITILTGHYGSGKSEIAVNLALDKKLDTLVDLDIVNPYFRSRSVHELLKQHGVDLVESTIERSLGSDLPFISAKGSRPFYEKNTTAVYDLAGTVAGAKILMQYGDIINPADVELLMVINIFRMETSNAEQIIKLIGDLEGAANVKITGLINNTNLMDETTEAHILEGEAVIKTVANHTNLPITHTFIEETVVTDRIFQGENRTLVRYLAKKWL